MKKLLMLAALAAASSFAAVGCDSGDEGEDCDGTDCFTCEEQPTVTYDTFGEGFLAAYCDGCHGSEVDDRQGAPDHVVFDTPEGAAEFADRILERTIPNDGSEATMPPAGGIAPDDAERLKVWLECYPP